MSYSKEEEVMLKKLIILTVSSIVFGVFLLSGDFQGFDEKKENLFFNKCSGYWYTRSLGKEAVKLRFEKNFYKKIEFENEEFPFYKTLIPYYGSYEKNIIAIAVYDAIKTRDYINFKLLALRRDGSVLKLRVLYDDSSGIIIGNLPWSRNSRGY
jgi:hypothetical protein